MKKEMIEEMKCHTDLYPWYWYSYGDGEYAFSVVEAWPVDENVDYPEPGTELEMDKNGNWCGRDGQVMFIEREISNQEHQNGDTICKFIAMAHAHFMKDSIKEANS